MSTVGHRSTNNDIYHSIVFLLLIAENKAIIPRIRYCDHGHLKRHVDQ